MINVIVARELQTNKDVKVEGLQRFLGFGLRLPSGEGSMVSFTRMEFAAGEGLREKSERSTPGT